MSLGCLFHQQLSLSGEQGQRRAGQTHQTPGPVSELCSPRTTTSRRKPEDGWGHQSPQSGHSCSRQLCLTAPWPASRCHSKNRTARGLWGGFAAVLKSGNCVFSIGSMGLLFSTTSTRKRCTLSTQWLLVCPLCHPVQERLEKDFPFVDGIPFLLPPAGSFLFQHPHLSPGAKLYSRALAMTFPYCPGPRHANLEIKGIKGCFGLHRAWAFFPP